MQNLFEDLKQLLAQDERLITEEGKLLKNMIIERQKLATLPRDVEAIEQKNQYAV